MKIQNIELLETVKRYYSTTSKINKLRPVAKKDNDLLKEIANSRSSSFSVDNYQVNLRTQFRTKFDYQAAKLKLPADLLKPFLRTKKVQSLFVNKIKGEK